MASPLKRASDLLRLAAKVNGGAYQERVTAALEAADVIAEHGLLIVEKPPEPPRRRRAEPDYDRVPEWSVIQIRRGGLRCSRCTGALFAENIAFLHRGAIVCDGCAGKDGIRI